MFLFLDEGSATDSDEDLQQFLGTASEQCEEYEDVDEDFDSNFGSDGRSSEGT